ncbi:MAG: 4Fe-4S dicluster domain-containing protein [Thermoanaerobaculales bacterium]|jgi:NAD-dependent dihydropyrimidine dehydrogenase PreA subunit|nr:4Fe-4S dicluster domain-containing protein [Thermoanaerobaculales bacterium]
MAVRQIIEIDQELCDGCGDCVSACAEGAIQLVDGKATLVKDSYCDGLGACLGDCHTGAITIIERDADGFDEDAVAAHLEKIGRAPAPKGALPSLDLISPITTGPAGGCPGSATRSFDPPAPEGREAVGGEASQLRHWPVQLHLVPPTAPFLTDSDLLLAADCVPFAAAGFHRRFLAGHSLAIACPKLDSNQQVYLDKLVTMIDQTGIRSIHVMVMEVPCCGGLVRLVRQAVEQASRSLPVRCTVIATDGGVKQELDLV